MLRTADEELTIDELAARAGVTVRTVRFYASRGLLPPPRLRGRLGLYGGDHLARLDLIRELQALGFTLSAIERHLERIPDDATPRISRCNAPCSRRGPATRAKTSPGTN
ncbi:MerR family transcriptional regulator [Saccharopolyspora gloriosae]|uniref:MerR family transcriptional regulator n=1 Tax=Saccharopolyspora gloriosae TaxID=455344 RepID=UPI001FB6EE3D|nr:MerR family transcriptional regulator [Saccharopolyspora gloriosae]